MLSTAYEPVRLQKLKYLLHCSQADGDAGSGDVRWPERLRSELLNVFMSGQYHLAADQAKLHQVFTVYLMFLQPVLSSDQLIVLSRIVVIMHWSQAYSRECLSQCPLLRC